MKKKIFKVIVFMVLILIILWNISSNLKTYSVYYAKHMPKGKGQYPEYIMLIDNLDKMIDPNIEGIEYDIDGDSTIRRNGGEIYFGNIYSTETEYIYRDADRISYRFNKNFEIVGDVIKLGVMKKIDINTIDKEKVIEEIKAFLDPVIDAQDEPIINLQWLFNLLYQDQFK